MSQTLFQLTEDRVEIDQILELLAKDGGEVSEETEAQIDAILLADVENKEAFAKKLDNYIWLIDELRGSSELKKQKAKQLSESAKTEDNKADRLEKRIYEGMKRLKKDELTGVHRKAKITSVGGKLAIDWKYEKIEDVPKKFRTQEKTWKIETDAVRELLESGKTLPFAELKPRGEKLSIK